MFNVEFSNEESEDVVAIFTDDNKNQRITVLTAPEETLGEEGPVVVQTSEDSISVIYSYEYFTSKLDKALQENGEDYGVQAAFGMGLALLLSKAVAAAEKKFKESSAND